jgi:hypothetical protein
MAGMTVGLPVPSFLPGTLTVCSALFSSCAEKHPPRLTKQLIPINLIPPKSIASAFPRILHISQNAPKEAVKRKV